MSELKECPFCRGEAKAESRYIGYGSIGIGSHDLYSVVCRECGAKSGEYKNKEKSINAWNTRATEAEPRALTWEELKLRNGKPIWVEYWSNRKYKGWFICGEYEWRQGSITDWIVINGLQEFSFDDYCKEFICYDRQPKGE